MRPLWPAALALVAACSDPPTHWTDRGPVAGNVACNPIAAEWDCLYPYPSDFFARPDPATPTAESVEIPGDALPHWKPPGDGPQPVDLLKHHPTDGFSVLPQIGVRIPGSVRADDLVPMYGDVSATLAAGSRTLILDAETGEKVLHFSETDPRPANVDDQVLLLRPLVRLKNAHRYIVALRGLHHVDGSDVAPPDGFRRIRDDDAANELQSRLVGYYDARIFPILEKAGVARSEVVLAWDFTTESEQRTIGDMLEMRRQLLATFAAPPAIKVRQVINAPDTENASLIGREIKATMTVPLFLESPDPGARIAYGADGKVRQNGTFEVPFTVRIPNSVLSGAKRGRIVQYGHGFFGSHLEMKGTHPSRFAEETGSILVGTDWMGMAELDQVDLLTKIIGDPAETASFVDRLHQGFVNFLTLGEVARTSLAALPEMQDAAGKPLYDASRLYYYGISQGSILGKTYVSLSPRIDRAALSVGGCSFGFMMSRALPFGTMLALLETTLRSAGEGDPKAGATRIELLMQTSLDRIDPVAYAPHLLSDTFDGAPAQRRVLLQIGIGDAQVPNVAEHVFARTLGIPLLAPPARPVFGLATQEGPLDGSALVEFDFGLAPVDAVATPVAHDTPVHEGVRRQPAAIQMIDGFLRENGTIVNTCGGVCRATAEP